LFKKAKQMLSYSDLDYAEHIAQRVERALIELQSRTGARLMSTSIEMNVEEQNEYQYRVRYDAWQYREPRDDGSDKIFLANIPLSWLDIVAYMVARKLLDEGWL
jgi:hypothetical protein